METASRTRDAEGSDALGYVYNKVRTVYVRTAPDEPVQGISLSTDLLEEVEPSSPEEAVMILEHLSLGWEGRLDEVDGAIFEPSASALEMLQSKRFDNSAVIDGAQIEWTVVDPETERMTLLVTRELEYTVTGTYLVRMTRAEYEEYVDANDEQEDGALEDLVTTAHRNSGEEPDPRVEFICEEEEQVENSFFTETETVSEDYKPDRARALPPYLTEATDAELKAEVDRRLAERSARK